MVAGWVSVDPSACEARKIVQVLLALFGVAFVGRLVLGADEAIGSPRLLRPGVKVAAGLPDRVLHITAVELGRSENPRFGLRVGMWER